MRKQKDIRHHFSLPQLALILWGMILSIGINFPAQAEQTIELKDGTIVRGELQSVQNGTYTVKTSTMGSVTIKNSDIVSIQNAVAQNKTTPKETAPLPGKTPTSPTQVSSHQLNQIQQDIMQNPQLMAEIQELAKDPQIIQLISDDSLLQSVSQKDVNGIAQNPNTQKLMENPKMKALVQKLQEQEKGQ